MPDSTANPLNNCTQCGGHLAYSYKANKNICEYCGSEFALAPPSDNQSVSEQPVSCIPFKRTKKEIESKLLNWLADGDLTPIDLLGEQGQYFVHKTYLPVYVFSGKYNGRYTTTGKNGEIITENTPISGKYDFVSFAKIEKGVKDAIIDRFYTSYKPDMYVPFFESELNDATVLTSESADFVWNAYGELEAASIVYDKLKAADSTKKYSHYLTYEQATSNISYLPFWDMTFSYLNGYYSVYVDDVSGEIVGEKPIDLSIKAKSKPYFYFSAVGVGIVIWICYWFIRFIEAMSTGKMPQGNNLLVSPIGQTYWFIRGLILIGISILMAGPAYKWYKKRHSNKFEGLRKRQLDLILSGKAPSPFI